MNIRNTNVKYGLLAIGLIVAIGLVLSLLLKGVIRTGITAGPDKLFGDQHLKTSVALVELHKVRYGEYPEDLSDLKFTGAWDAIHTSSVFYVRSEDKQSYFLEVKRGWLGKPQNLSMDEEFWQGTGYDISLYSVR